MSASSELRKQLFDVQNKLTALNTKRAIASQSKQKTFETKADCFIQKKEQKNKEYIEFLKKEQELALSNCQRKIEEIQIAADRKIALIQIDIDCKNKYYSDKIASLSFTTIQPPPVTATPILDRLEFEISELEAKSKTLEKFIPILEVNEREEAIKQQELERQIKRKNALYEQQTQYNSESAIRERAKKSEEDQQRQILLLHREAEEEDRRSREEEEEIRRDRLLIRKELGLPPIKL